MFADFKRCLQIQIASIVETVRSDAVPDNVIEAELDCVSEMLTEAARDLEHVRDKDFIVHGLDERRARKILSCTWQELRRWREDGRFPKTEGTVRSFGRGYMHTFPTIVQGWRPETIAAIKPKVEIWREEHKAVRKAARKSQAAA